MNGVNHRCVDAAASPTEAGFGLDWRCSHTRACSWRCDRAGALHFSRPLIPTLSGAVLYFGLLPRVMRRNVAFCRVFGRRNSTSSPFVNSVHYLPLSFLSRAPFYKIDVLPGIFQGPHKGNPLFYLIDGFPLRDYGRSGRNLPHRGCLLRCLWKVSAPVLYRLVVPFGGRRGGSYPDQSRRPINHGQRQTTFSIVTIPPTLRLSAADGRPISIRIRASANLDFIAGIAGPNSLGPRAGKTSTEAVTEQMGKSGTCPIFVQNSAARKRWQTLLRRPAMGGQVFLSEFRHQKA